MNASGATMYYTCMYYVICIMFPNFGACVTSYLIVNWKKMWLNANASRGNHRSQHPDGSNTFGGVNVFKSFFLALHFVPTAASLWHPLCTSEILPTSSGKMTLCKVLTMQSRIINEEAHSVSFTVLYLTHPLWLQVSLHITVMHLCGSCHLLCVNNNSAALWEGVTNNLSLRKLSSFRDW